MTVVLGLDLGTKQGFSRFDTETRGLLLGWNDWGKLPTVDRAIGFGNWLEAILGGTVVDVRGQIEATDLAPITVIGYEQVTFGQGRADMIMKQEGLLQWMGQGVAFQGINVATLKKFALGTTAPKRLSLKGLPRTEANRLKAEQRKLVKGMMIEAAKKRILGLGQTPPETMKDDTADAMLVLCWILENSLEGGAG